MKIEITKRTITTAEMKDIVEYEIANLDVEPCTLRDLEKLRDYIDAYVARELKSSK